MSTTLSPEERMRALRSCQGLAFIVITARGTRRCVGCVVGTHHTSSRAFSSTLSWWPPRSPSRNK